VSAVLPTHSLLPSTDCPPSAEHLRPAAHSPLLPSTGRAKNTKNILLKNVLDACVGAIAFWSFGFAFAYGEAGGGNPFVGNTYFFMTNFGGVSYGSWCALARSVAPVLPQPRHLN
jgi:hypothetical protein